jgi:hypothetical protein
MTMKCFLAVVAVEVGINKKKEEETAKMENGTENGNGNGMGNRMDVRALMGNPWTSDELEAAKICASGSGTINGDLVAQFRGLVPESKRTDGAILNKLGVLRRRFNLGGMDKNKWIPRAEAEHQVGCSLDKRMLFGILEWHRGDNNTVCFKRSQWNKLRPWIENELRNKTRVQWHLYPGLRSSTPPVQTSFPIPPPVRAPLPAVGKASQQRTTKNLDRIQLAIAAYDAGIVDAAGTVEWIRKAIA